MSRTTTTAVQSLLETGGDYDLKRRPSLQVFVDTANVVTTRVAACAVRNDDPLTSDELELIERWLSAHAYAMSDQTYAGKSTGGASGSFQGQTGMRLEATKYGQMALSIDHSGCLAKIANKSNRIRFGWAGKVPSEQIDYDERD